MKPDFSGYATKAGVRCSDGRTIMPNAFLQQDKQQVPLVWQHGHDEPENVLGHVLLENRDDGVYAYGFFNDTPKAKHAAAALAHKDIKHMSIWANNLVEKAKQVVHGKIREVSLVLSGANPGAVIENVTIQHDDGDQQMLDDEAIITSGDTLVHDEDGGKKKNVSHSGNDDGGSDDGQTVDDIYNSMSDDQKEFLHMMVGAAASGNKVLEQSATGEDGTQEDDGKKVNVFENGENGDGASKTGATISHDDMKGILDDARKLGSLETAIDNYAIQHGITNIDILFPEHQMVDGQEPKFFARRMEWVAGVLNGASKRPFARIKSATADLTYDEARAKGYITGELKKEQFFEVSKRQTEPQTIYKKQKLDRDDIIDITDFNVVSWIKGEMRMMLDEELARAVLFGDGRDAGDDDRINPTNIRPIATDDEFYTVTVNVNIDDANSDYEEVLDAIIRSRRHYRGSGNPTFYTTAAVISEFLLLRDGQDRKIYRSIQEVANELQVDKIVAVEALEDEAYSGTIGVIVNMKDYVIGADKGGNVSMFDDFDIDYNQHKYLIETRVSGALIRPKSALVIKKVAATDILVTPAAPTWDSNDEEFTIIDTTGVTYSSDVRGAVTNAGSPYTVAAGTTETVTATPDNGYYFLSSEDDTWEFTADPA